MKGPPIELGGMGHHCMPSSPLVTLQALVLLAVSGVELRKKKYMQLSRPTFVPLSMQMPRLL